MGSASEIQEISLAVRNFATREVVLYLEPWAEEFRLAPQAELVLVGRGPKRSSGFAVDYEDDGIVVSAWAGSVVRVFCKGVELGDVRQRPAVPDFD